MCLGVCVCVIILDLNPNFLRCPYLPTPPLIPVSNTLYCARAFVGACVCVCVCVCVCMYVSCGRTDQTRRHRGGVVPQRHLGFTATLHVRHPLFQPLLFPALCLSSVCLSPTHMHAHTRIRHAHHTTTPAATLRH